MSKQPPPAPVEEQELETLVESLDNTCTNYKMEISVEKTKLSVRHPTHKSGVLGSIPGLATYFRFSFRFFKKDSCQLLAKVCARSTG